MVAPRIGLTFDDVLVAPAHSIILPKDADLSTRLTSTVKLNLPLLSAAMDTVTESATAISLARLGGMGVIHKNLALEQQAEEVRRVKNSEFLVVYNPVTISPDTTLQEIRQLRFTQGISSFPVLQHGKLVGMVTKRDYRFEENPAKRAGEMMSKNLVLARKEIGMKEAAELLKEHRIEKLPIVDRENRLKGLITSTDIEKQKRFPDALKDKKGRLMVGAAVGPKDDARVEKLLEADCDVIFLDTSHGHSQRVIDAVKRYKKDFDCEIVAGNVATAKATRALIKAGADAVKVGLGPGSICTTRVVTGVGVPQVTAIADCAKAAGDIPLVADGGIRYSGDILKALVAGASSVMMGSLFAGCKETPGKVIYLNHRKFKQYRGMGSVGAMSQGSADRYMQDFSPVEKLVPEGVEGMVPMKGPLSELVFQLMGGLRAGMGLTGARTVKDLRSKELVQVTAAGVKESHPHDVLITEESSNYP